MHWKRHSFLALTVVLGFVLCSSPALARPFFQLLEEIVSGHDLVKAAEARRDGAKARLSYARGERMPHLEAVANVGPERIDFPGDARTTNEVRDTQRLAARQLLFDFGRSGAGISRAQSGLERAEAELIAVRQEVLLQGVTACLDVLRHRERLRLARESEKRIIEQTGIEETLVTKGAGLASDVLQAKSQLAGARAQLARVEGQLAVARNRFMTVFGLEPTEDLLADLDLPVAPFDRAPSTQADAAAAALESSVEVQVASFNVDMARQDVAGAKAGYFPRLHLVGEAERQHDDQGIDGTRTEARGMVELTWDVFSGGKQQALTREARSALMDHELRLDDLRKRVEERVAEAWQEMLTTRENARLLRDQAQILEEFLGLAKRERLLGTRSLLDVLNGEVGHLNAQSNAVSAETDRTVALYNLFHAMGKLDLDLMR
jgi:adhesin transport system outer membrane protein